MANQLALLDGPHPDGVRVGGDDAKSTLELFVVDRCQPPVTTVLAPSMVATQENETSFAELLSGFELQTVTTTSNTGDETPPPKNFIGL